jgi:hypothetical protein
VISLLRSNILQEAGGLSNSPSSTISIFNPKLVLGASSLA